MDTRRAGRSIGRMAMLIDDGPAVGDLLRFWRRRRRMSQLDLAGDARVSTKHLSFIETGRAQPSRQLLLHLVEELQIPLRERNRLLLAAGFAPHYRDLPFEDRRMDVLRDALDGLLTAHQPNPALVVNAHWDLIAHNEAATLLWEGVDPALLAPPVNMLRLTCHPDGMPRISTATPVCSRTLVDALRRESRDHADEHLLDLVEEMEGYLAGSDEVPPDSWSGNGVMATFGLHTRLGEVRLFTIIATLGAPLEVTAGDLAIETFLPADAASAALLRELAA
jgi:transcriptional regulator with XRE-family HTH domain